MWLISSGNELKFHNCETYHVEHVHRPSDHSGHIRNISWCKDGSWLALVPSRGNAEIIGTKDNLRLLQSVLGVAQPTVAVFQKTTKKNLAMSTLGGELFVFDIKSRGIKKYFSPNSATPVICMDWSSKDTHLAIGNETGEVILYSNITNQKTSILSIPGSKTVSVVRFHTTQRSILGTASDEGTVAVWDINSSMKKVNLKSHQAPVTDMVFSSQNRNLMVSVGFDRIYQCYDINAGTAGLSGLADHPLSTVDMAADGYTIAVGSSRGSVYVYDLRQHKNPLAVIAAHAGEVKKVLYQPTALSSDSVNITEHNTTEMTNNLETKQSASIDSFGLHTVSEFCPIDFTEHETDVKLRSKSTEGDSFFSFIDLNKGERVNSKNLTKDNSEISTGISDGMKKWSDIRLSSVVFDGHESKEKVSDVLPLGTVKGAASTPQNKKCSELTAVIMQEMNSPHLSPVPIDTALLLNTNQLKSMIKDVVSEVVTDQMSDMMFSLTRNFLNVQMCICKQFVKQEMKIEIISDHIQNIASNPSARYQELMEENEFLKSQINLLLNR